VEPVCVEECPVDAFTGNGDLQRHFADVNAPERRGYCVESERPVPLSLIQNGLVAEKEIPRRLRDLYPAKSHTRLV